MQHLYNFNIFAQKRKEIVLKRSKSQSTAYTEALQNSRERSLTKDYDVFINMFLLILSSMYYAVVLYTPMVFNLNIPQKGLKLNLNSISTYIRH